MRDRYYPKYLLECDFIRELVETQQNESDSFNIKMREVFKENFIATTEKSIKKWEEFLSIDIDTSLSLQVRRDRIQAKLTTNPQTTIELLKTTANSFFEEDVVEIYDNIQNLIKPFSHGEWFLSENARIMDDDIYIRLTTDEVDDFSKIKVNVIEDRDYVFSSIKDNNSFIKFRFLTREEDLIEEVIVTEDVYGFKTPESCYGIEIILTNNEQGEFDFRKLMLVEGTQEQSYFKYKEYIITVKFNRDTHPDFLKTLQKSLKELIPAHLFLDYLLEFLRIRELEQLTISDLENTKIESFI